MLHTLNSFICILLRVVFLHFSSVQSLSRVWLFETPWTAVCQTSLSIATCPSPTPRVYLNSCVESVMSSHPLSSLSPPTFNLPQHQSFPMSQLQHHSSKASVLQCSAFFIVQLSHPYMTTGKTIPLIRWTFFGKVMSLLFNMLSRLVITFLPRSKHLLISWLQSPSAVILKSKTINSVTASPSICHEVMGLDAMMLLF